jgi:hypothetical protein
MPDRGWIEPIVERVVGQVLESHAAQLRSEIVHRVMEEIAAQQPAAALAPAAPNAAELARAVSEIQLGTSQKEILRALLDSSSGFAARAALFVVKGSHATGWQARGFSRSEAIKDFALNSSAPAVVRALANRSASAATDGDFDGQFLEQFGRPKGDARLLPLILKDKVAALVYADGGTDGGLLDAGALEVLVLSTSSWLEVTALRKQAHKEPAPEARNAPVAETASTQNYNDPFAGHAPAFSMAAAASAGAAEAHPAHPGHAESAVEMQSAAAEAVAEPLPIGQAGSAAAEAAPASPAVSSEDQDVMRKAQRFARLLVDEIKLYNQAKVSEGRKNKDLYDRLKDTIEKSRATYQKRYGNTVAASGNYFQHELIRSLAEDDASLMGSNFRL